MFCFPVIYHVEHFGYQQNQVISRVLVICTLLTERFVLPSQILVRHLTGSLTPSNYLVLGMIMPCMQSSFLRCLTPFSVTGRCSRLGLEGMALQFFEQNCSCKHVHKGRSNLFLALFTFLHILTYLGVKL